MTVPGLYLLDKAVYSTVGKSTEADGILYGWFPAVIIRFYLSGKTPGLLASCHLIFYLFISEGSLKNKLYRGILDISLFTVQTSLKTRPVQKSLPDPKKKMKKAGV